MIPVTIGQFLLFTLRSILISFLLAGGSLAAEPVPAEPVSFDIEVQPLDEAPTEFARQSDREIFFSSGIAEEKAGNLVDGTFEPDEALHLLLTDTKLDYAVTDSRTFPVTDTNESGQPGKVRLTSRQTPTAQASATTAQSQSEASGSRNNDYPGEATTVEEIIVTGSVVRSLNLQSESDTGSRLGLSAFETPATVDVIGNETMRARGLLSVTEAAESLVGVNSGENPGAPSAFFMRGFTDNQITSLRDGLRIGPASMVMRPQNTFNLEKVEILKGPASVLYGEGAVAGTINAVTKKARLGQPASYEFLATYGRFDTYQLGFGTGGSFSEGIAYRFDVSETGSNGWVDRTPSKSTNVTTSIRAAVSETLEASLSLDFLDDDLPNNWGQPLLPNDFVVEPITGVVDTKDFRSIDRRMRFTNYNVSNDKSESEAMLSHLEINWRPSDAISVDNQTYRYVADRAWFNAEQYVFDPASELITRDRFFVSHDQEIIGNRLDLVIVGEVGGKENAFVIGADYNKIDFTRIKGFPDGDSVDPINPQPGLFGEILESKKARAVIKTAAVYFEDSLEATHKLRLVTGGRAEQIDLDRDDFTWSESIGGGVLDPSQSFELDFDFFTWRVGAIYEFTDTFVTYAQFSNGKDPVGTELFSVEANEQFDLASSRMWEMGLKALIAGESTEITAAYYDIMREDLLTQVGQDEVANVGDQESRGVEFALSTAITEDWTADFNAAYVIDAKYGEVFLPFLGDATGNAPPNVPEWIVNAWTSVDNIAGLPLEVGGGIRYVDERFADVANIVVLDDYVIINAFIAYTFDNIRFMVRSRNVADEEYVPWVSPWYPNQVALGSPRTLEFSIEGVFR